METNQPKIAGYEIIGRLGAGGMGIVWEAVQLSTRRRVALKLLSEASLGSERRKTRFVREVELAASLEHPNIARVYDSGLDKGVYYYAMELVKGPSLDEFVSQRKLKPKQIMILMRRVCQAMAYAHGRGVVHRDLKPSNILVDRNGQPHILDFGLAKLLDSDDSMALSLDGDVTGTPMYMSPEQAAGEVGKIDARTDVYALGIIAYRLLTGSTPHDMSGTYLQVIRRVAEEEVRRPILAGVKTDAEMEAILLKALARDPAQRYANAGELGEDIGRYLDGEPILARPAGLMHTATRQLRKHRWPAMVAALAVALVGMTVALFVSLARKQAAPVAPGGLAVVPPPIVQRAVAATQPIVVTTPIAETQTAVPPATPKAVEISAPAPGEIITNSIGMKLTAIMPGTFLMGSPETEDGRSDDQRQHQVTLTKPFYLGTTPVTVAEFTAFVNATNYQTDAEREGSAEQISGGFRSVDGASWRNPGYAKADDDPVVDMSWNDAAAFCEWLSGKEGRKYRLPTEAEWEYACRAGTQTTYFWGDDVSLVRDYAYGEPGVDHAPRVGQKKPNPWGLYDMVGIVWQWCGDRYGEYPDGAAVDPQGASEGNRRVLRGGGWYNNPAVFHSAGRFPVGQGGRRDCWSFRVVLEGESVGPNQSPGTGVLISKPAEILPPAPPAPDGVTATAGDGQVTVTWLAVQDATSYTISYDMTTGHDTRDVKELKGTGYTVSGLTNGISYYFIVKAVNSGGSTAHTPVAVATPQAPQVDLNRGLVLHFSCDKRETGGVVKDESGNGNDGRLTGAHWIPAGRGGAYQFAASRRTDAIVVSDSTSVNVQQITLAAWIRTTQHDRSPHRIFDKDWRSGFALTLRGGNIAADQGKLEMDIGLQSVVSDVSVANGAWHLVAGTYDGAMQKLYIDAKEQGTISPWAGNIERHVFPIQIGNGNNKLNAGEDGQLFAFDGEISDMRMYDRALSKEEIGRLFADAPLRALAPNPRAAVPVQPAQLPPPVTAAGKKPGETITNAIGMKLAYIPAGVFLMGSPETEDGRSDDQRQHQVTLTTPFYLGVTPVTVGQFTAFAKATNYQTDAEKEGFADQVSGGFRKVDGASWRNPGYIQVDDDPVVDLSWNDATAFCDWLQSKEGGKYRLPSEAEWEYSCRAGTRSMYFWGDEVSLVRNYAYGQPGVDHAPRVGQKKPNPWGLYDMVGIVWQWCDYRYAEYPDGAAIDPQGPTEGNRRVLRGGGWYNNPGVFHSAGRFDRTQAERRDCWSFRVVREIPNP